MSSTHFEGLTDNLRKVLAEAEMLLKSVAAGAGDGLDDAGAHAQESLRRAYEHLRAAEREIADRAHSLNRTVHAHPWQAIAATGVVAFLLGLWVRRR
jgi:ElaB/YqjD/DUF883 family membrane-anchored ribosome-binding protein